MQQMMNAQQQYQPKYEESQNYLRSTIETSKYPLVAVFAASLLVAAPKDIARARRRKNGRRLKGPEVVTAAQFNRRNRSDGIGFVQHQSLAEKLTGRTQCVRIPRGVESSHILIMGDTGTGKSVLTRTILLEVERRGETAIVYDPALKYTPQFGSFQASSILALPGSRHVFGNRYEKAYRENAKSAQQPWLLQIHECSVFINPMAQPLVQLGILILPPLPFDLHSTRSCSRFGEYKGILLPLDYVAVECQAVPRPS